MGKGRTPEIGKQKKKIKTENFHFFSFVFKNSNEMAHS